MKKQPFVSFSLAGVSLTDFGLSIPSPFCSLQINNSQTDTYTNWQLTITVGGNASKLVNVASFEALLYSAAQSAGQYSNSSGIPVSFIFGWLDDKGNASDYLSYQGWTIQFTVSTSGQFMNYVIKGYASLAVQMSMPVFNVPAICGWIQPSAVFEGFAKAIKADSYYDLDIDHCDDVTLINHGAMTTSMTGYVRGNKSGEDDYDDFPGLLKLSKSYNSARDACGIVGRKLSTLMNNLSVSPLSSYLKAGLTDNTPQCSSFSYWVDEPTMTQRGVIHYKSNSGLSFTKQRDTLEFGTANTNIISIDGSYNGVAYDMTDMSFASLGFDVDGSGNTVLKDAKVINSWSSSLALTFQTASIINDVNAIASQFAGQFSITVPGTIRQYKLAQPISLIVMQGNTLSPISGIYNIMSVSHDVRTTFVTTLKVERLSMSTANQVAMSQGIMTVNSKSNTFATSAYSITPNVKSRSKVDFGEVYPTFEHLVANSETITI